MLMDKTPTNNVGIFSYVFSTLWLLIPLITLILFDQIHQHVSKGISIYYFQMIYLIITLSISYYFVDKNAYQSKLYSIGSATHNSLITFLLIRMFMHFNPFKNCYNNLTQNTLLFGILVILFISQTIVTNKNNESSYNLLHMFGLILLNILLIHWCQ